MKSSQVKRSFKENFISTLVKSFVLVLSLSLFIENQCTCLQRRKKTRFVALASMSQERQYEAKTLPKAEKNQAERKRSSIILFANRAVARRI